jgi:hypothetical protein
MQRTRDEIRRCGSSKGASRLDWLINEALDDLDAGRCTD